MSTVDIEKKLVDIYYSLIMNLSSDNKLRLIERLSKSLRTSKNKENVDLIDSLYGSWESDKSADEIIREIKEARNFNRKEIEL